MHFHINNNKKTNQNIIYINYDQKINIIYNNNNICI